MEGKKQFPCEYCEKVCKSKGGLTRHSRSKHPDKQPANIPVPVDMQILEKILSEIVKKLLEEKIYPKAILDTLTNLKPSENFLKFVTKVFTLFCRKRNQDTMLAMFYGEIVKDWKLYFPPCDNQIAINVLLIHLPQKLVSYHKTASNTQQNEEVRRQNVYCILHCVAI